MKSYRELIVWQKSVKLVTIVYNIISGFPNDEKFGLSSQIKRSAVSVPSNIAEGYGRNYTRDYLRFLQIARGPLYELQTQLEIAINLGFIKPENLDDINSLTLEVEKMLNKLISKLKSNL